VYYVHLLWPLSAEQSFLYTLNIYINTLCVIGKIGAIASFLLLEDVAREKYNIWSRSSLPWKTKHLPCF